jgi:tripartite-type tricarboxylate transporter receptor subunit TctC
MKRRFAVWMTAIGIAAGASLAWQTAAAQSYPAKPVRVVVPYPPGGPTDIVARVLFQQVADSTGQQFVIDNRAGAGGNIGAELVARAPADGYTLLVATTAHAINASLFKKLNYDVVKDFVPVSLLTQGPLVLVAHPQFPANSVRELIDLARAKPGAVNYASSGNGQSTHLSAELFNSMAGVKMAHVPYKGSAPALADVMSGQVGVMFDTSLSAMPFVKTGKLKALGVTSPARTPAAPQVPTIAESGLAGYEVFAWNGVLAPVGTPAVVVQQLNEQINRAMQLTQVREKFAAQGFAASGNSSDQFREFLQKELSKWSQTVAASGATID